MTICLAPIGGPTKRGELGELADFPPTDSFRLSMTKGPLFGDPSLLITVSAHTPAWQGRAWASVMSPLPHHLPSRPLPHHLPSRPLSPFRSILRGRILSSFGWRGPGWLLPRDSLEDVSWMCQWGKSRPSTLPFLQTIPLTIL